MNFLKKLVVGILVSTLVFNVFVGNNNNAKAFDETKLSGQCGDNVFWRVDIDSSTLVIWGQGKMKDYALSNTTFFPTPWSDFNNISNIIIEEGVINLGAGAFHSMNIEDIKIASSVQSIGFSCFDWCRMIERIDVPEGVINIGHHAFVCCSSLKEINLPTTLTNIGSWAFNMCNKLEKIELPFGVHIEENVFESCIKLKTIHYKGNNLRYELPNNTLKEYLTTHSKTMGDWNTVTEASCNAEGLQTRECSVCHEIEQKVIEKLPHSYGDWETVREPTCKVEGEKIRTCSNCGEIEHMSISKLSHIYGSWITTRQPSCSREGEKQKTCSKCGDIQTELIEKLPHTYEEKVIKPTRTEQGYTLHICSVCGENYKSDYIDPSTIYKEGNCGTNTTYVLNKETGLLQIEGSGNMTNYDNSNPPWFAERSLIKKVEISQGVTSVGNGAFSDCNNLETVTLSNGIRTIGNETFENCQKLSSITLPNNLQTIGDYTFENCVKLNNIAIPNKVTSIGNGAFYNCDSLTKIVVPSSVSSLGTFVFASCTKLQTAELKNNPSAIVEGLFEDCESLKNFTIPNTVKKIEDNAFSGCSSLTSLNIPSGVTGIGNGAYSYCSGIKTVIIPLSTIWIGDDAFVGCDSLVATYYLGNKDEWSFVYMGKNNDKLISGLNFHVCAYTKTKVVKPTYTSKGYTIHICEVCGKQYIDSYVNALKKITKVPSTKIKKIKAKKKSLKLTWKKARGITGYKIQYSLKKSFRKTKMITIKKVSATSKTIKKLKKKKKYYIRIRTYLIANGKTYSSAWSKVKAKRTK